MYSQIIHWTALAIYIGIFGYAGLQKILSLPVMMENMAKLGFDAKWTVAIGMVEILGVAGIIVGFFIQPVKVISVLLLLPIAIGAFAIHMSNHHPFLIYWQALTVCMLSVIILWTDSNFKLVLD